MTHEDAEKKLRKMLGSQVRVTLSDGRVMSGVFECIDQGMNAIVRDNKLGLVMVPGVHVAKFEVQEREDKPEDKDTAKAAGQAAGQQQQQQQEE